MGSSLKGTNNRRIHRLIVAVRDAAKVSHLAEMAAPEEPNVYSLARESKDKLAPLGAKSSPGPTESRVTLRSLELRRIFGGLFVYKHLIPTG